MKKSVRSLLSLLLISVLLLASAASAAIPFPSVQGGDGVVPEKAEFVDEDGNVQEVEVVRPTKENPVTQEKLDNDGLLLVTPVCLREYAPRAIDERLEQGYQSVSAVYDIVDLFASDKTGTVIRDMVNKSLMYNKRQNLETLMKQQSAALESLEAAKIYLQSIQDYSRHYISLGHVSAQSIPYPVSNEVLQLVMTEMFDISAGGKLAAYLNAAPENYIVVSVNLNTTVMQVVNFGEFFDFSEIITHIQSTNEYDDVVLLPNEKKTDEEIPPEERKKQNNGKNVLNSAIADYDIAAGLMILLTKDGINWYISAVDQYGVDEDGLLLVRLTESYMVYGIARSEESAEIKGFMEEGALTLWNNDERVEVQLVNRRGETVDAILPKTIVDAITKDGKLPVYEDFKAELSYILYWAGVSRSLADPVQ